MGQTSTAWIAVIGSVVTILVTTLNFWFSQRQSKERFDQDKQKLHIDGDIKRRAELDKTEREVHKATFEKLIIAVSALQKFRDFVLHAVRSGRIGDIITSKSVTDKCSLLKETVEGGYATLAPLYSKQELQFLHDAKTVTGSLEQELLQICKGNEYFPRLNEAQLGTLTDIHAQLSSTQEQLMTLVTILNGRRGQ
jgi:hypothetical protein